MAARERGGGNPSNVDVAILHEVVAARPDGTTHEVAAEYNRRVRRNERVHRRKAEGREQISVSEALRRYLDELAAHAPRSKPK